MRTILLLLAFLLPLLAGQARAASAIAAVVNDEAITDQDVNDRINLLFASSGMPDNPENRASLRDRVMHSLIDEKLEMQEAKKYNLDVDKAETDKALNTIGQQNGMTGDQMLKFLESRGASRQTLADQLTAMISWSKVIQRVLRPQVAVGDDEVAAALERIKANEGKTEYQLSEIFIAVENPQDDAKAHTLADDLVRRMQQGNTFSSLAQQFSQGAGAINGGDMGWIQPGQLQGELDKVARNLQVKSISPPIRLADGYHIIGKRDERTITAADPAAVELSMRQAAYKMNGKSPEQVKPIVAQFRQLANSCAELGRVVPQYPDWLVSNLGDKRVGDLPPWLGKIVGKLAVDVPSAPFEKDGYAIVLYVCQRNESGSDKSALVNSIGNEKLQLQARRLLRDLRRSAAIDIRGG